MESSWFIKMGSNGGVRTEIAIYGTWPRAGGLIAGISDIFIHYASLRSSAKKKTISSDGEYPQLQSPARAPRESEMCSRELVPRKVPRQTRPSPLIGGESRRRPWCRKRQRSIAIRYHACWGTRSSTNKWCLACHKPSVCI